MQERPTWKRHPTGSTVHGAVEGTHGDKERAQASQKERLAGLPLGS